MPRFIYLLGLGLAMIGLAFAMTDWAMGLAPEVTEANVRRIKPGMTLREVEAILGKDSWPAGCSGTLTNQSHDYEWFGVDGVAFVRFWSSLSDRRMVVHLVQFRRDPDSKAKSAVFRPALSQSPFQRLRAWLGL